MSRAMKFVAWFAGATVSMLAYWYVVVYVFDEFNHGYGHVGWFALNVYVGFLSEAAGLVGCVAIALFRRQTWAFTHALARGCAFTLCALVWAFALTELFPDRDVALQTIAGALVIGLLTLFAIRPTLHRAAS